MRRLIAFAALALAATPVFAAGSFVTRGVNDASGFHYQSFYDESGVGTGPFDPVYSMPAGTGGSGSGGGAVYGTDATGGAPTKPPLFIAGVDGSGNIKPFTITANGLQFFDTTIEQALGGVGDAAYTGSGNASLIAIEKSNNAKLAAGVNALQGGQANTASNPFFEQTVGPSMQAPGTAPTIVRGIQGAPGGIPVIVSQSAGATITTSQPNVTNTAAALAFSGTAHREVQNLGSAPIYIGASGVTTTTGWPIPPGTSYDATRFSGTLYAIAAASQPVALISY